MGRKQFCIIILFLSAMSVNAQFGRDKTIRHFDNYDKNAAKIEIAYNGWIYVAYTVVMTSGTNSGGYGVVCSKDHGNTWEFIAGGILSTNRCIAVDIAVTGAHPDSLVVYIAGIFMSQGIDPEYDLFVLSYDGNTGDFIDENFRIRDSQVPFFDIAIASDYRYPAAGTNPYSVAFVYSVGHFSSADSIKYIASVDGGLNFSVKQYITDTNGRVFRKVSIDYGRSNSEPGGKYYVAWESLSDRLDRAGSIYIAKNNGDVSSPFTAPMRLDSANIHLAGVCGNPKISVQQSAANNDSNSCTAVVLVETLTNYDIVGFYNKRAPVSDHWHHLNVTTTVRNEQLGNITYDPDSNLFCATYADSTNLQLAYVKNEMNLSAPSNWRIITGNYADSGNVNTDPVPKVAVSPVDQKAAIVWTMDLGYRTLKIDRERIILPAVYISDTICDDTTYHFNNQIIAEPGIYTSIISTASGADSTVILTLAVNAVEPIITQSGSTLTTGSFSSYQWYRNENAIPNASFQSYHVTQVGYYTVAVVDSYGCHETSERHFVTLNDVADDLVHGVKVYPNPANEFLWIDVEPQHKVLITITSIEGKELLNKKLSGKHVINMQGFSQGIYLMKLQTEKEMATLKIFKY